MKTQRGALLVANLPQLQNLVKRDPPGYRDEFLQQLRHFESVTRILELKPEDQDAVRRFHDLVGFLSQVSVCYPTEMAHFPSHLQNFMTENYSKLQPDTRKVLLQNIVLLRHKGAIDSITLLQTLFPLFSRTTSTALRSFIRKTILSEIQQANAKTNDHKLNRAVQVMLFGMVERGTDGQVQDRKGKARDIKGSQMHGSEEDAMWAVSVTRELWRKRTWKDERAVSIVALGCLHPVLKVQSASVHFFIGDDNEQEDSDDEEGNPVKIRDLEKKRTVTKKRKGSEKKHAEAVKKANKKHNENRNKPAQANFPALYLLRDPQTFGEKLYDFLHNHDKKLPLDHKLLLVQLLSRIMGAHKLCILGFYTYLMKYLTYHQLKITLILVSLAQSVHDLTPPDVLSPVVQKIAKEFVHPGVSSEVIAAGINSIREVCRRQPWCIEEDLLGDLIEYRKSKDKGVMMSARSLLQLYRDVNPGMLKKRERGKDASTGVTEQLKALPFGHSQVAASGIADLELLENFLREQQGEDGNQEIDDEAAWAAWEAESDSSDSSSESEDGWIDVASDGSDVDISDDEDNKKEASAKSESHEASIPSQLATTKILTPADFALLETLRSKSEAATSGTKRKLASSKRNTTGGDGEEHFVSEFDITGARKKAKADYEERMESVRQGREGREKFGSSKGKQKSTPSSTTNREKARNKPVMMILASRGVRGKKKASLRDKQKKLRAHIDRAKKSY